MDDVLNRLETLYKSYEKERDQEDGIIDLSVACDLADSAPYLIKQSKKVESLEEYIEHLEHEKRLLYGRLNNIRDLVDKEIK